jgi:hypothetical protein
MKGMRLCRCAIPNRATLLHFSWRRGPYGTRERVNAVAFSEARYNFRRSQKIKLKRALKRRQVMIGKQKLKSG